MQFKAFSGLRCGTQMHRQVQPPTLLQDEQVYITHWMLLVRSLVSTTLPIVYFQFYTSLTATRYQVDAICFRSTPPYDMDTGSGSSGSRDFRGTGRRGWAPRGGFTRGRYASARKRNNMRKPDLIKHPLGELLTTITMTDLQSEKQETASKITDCQYVASYNWLSKATPTILVPGKISLPEEAWKLTRILRQTSSLEPSLRPTKTQRRQWRLLP